MYSRLLEDRELLESRYSRPCMCTDGQASLTMSDRSRAYQLLFGTRERTAIEPKFDQARTNSRCINAVPRFINPALRKGIV